MSAPSDDRLTRAVLNGFCQVQTDQTFRRFKVKMAALNCGLERGVEHPQYFSIRKARPLDLVFEVRIGADAVDVDFLHQTERPKEDSPQEFAFAIDAHVQQVF